MKREITFKGQPANLIGVCIDRGDAAPDFRITGQVLGQKTLADYKGKIKVITTFPSLDTSVCDLQVKEFNKEAASFSKDIVVLGISMDLPFAQKRFCETNEIKNVFVLSDYKYKSLGINYGLYIKDLHLLARSVMILDKNNVIRYMDVVSELTNPPDYAEAKEALKNIASEKFKPGEHKNCEHDKAGWLIEGNLMCKVINLSSKEELLLYGEILNILSYGKNFDFAVDSKEKKIKLIINNEDPGMLLLLNRIII